MDSILQMHSAGRDKENAYLTLEAALVIPVLFGTILFTVYIFLFQYNRCLMEQDLGAMALWGSSVEESGRGTLEEMTRERMADMYWDKYVAWRFKEMKAELRKNLFSVKGRAELAFPVPGWNYWSGENVWEAKSDYEYRRLSPVTFIRLCRGVKNHLK